MGYGYGIRVEQGTIICTKNIGIPHWTVLLNKCTTRWLPDTEWGSLAFKSSKLPPFQLSFARGRALNSFTTPRLSSLLSTRRLGPQTGSSRPPIRHQGLTSLCNCILDWVFLFLLSRFYKTLEELYFMGYVAAFEVLNNFSLMRSWWRFEWRFSSFLVYYGSLFCSIWALLLRTPFICIANIA